MASWLHRVAEYRDDEGHLLWPVIPLAAVTLAFLIYALVTAGAST